VNIASHDLTVALGNGQNGHIALGGLVGDPAATAGQAQDPVDFLIELGTPPRAARFFVPILRGAVTDAVCALLPKAGTDVPAQWLMATSLVQVQLTPGLIYDLEPSLSSVHVAAGTLPGQMMYPVWYELNARAQQQPSVRGTAPAPSKELLAFRKSAERTASDLFGAYFGRGQAQEGLATLSEGSAKAAAGLDHHMELGRVHANLPESLCMPAVWHVARRDPPPSRRVVVTRPAAQRGGRLLAGITSV
jgi:hypothetical protein